MNCDQINNQFEAYWNRELDFAETTKIRNHLLKCNSCKTAYLAFLDTQYKIEKAKYNTNLPEMTNFMDELQQKMAQQKPAKRGYNYRHWAIAATVILFTSLLLFEWLYFPAVPQKSNSLEALIATNKWTQVEHILTDPQLLKKYAHQPVSVLLVQKRLNQLEKTGIEFIAIALDNLNQYSFSQRNPDNIFVSQKQAKIPLHIMHQLLQQYRAQKQHISIHELINFIIENQIQRNKT